MWGNKMNTNSKCPKCDKMKEKPLHEKKMSEIIQDSQDRYEEIDWGSYNKCMRFVGDNFKQWAIAVVKNIRKKREKSLKELEKTKCPKCGQSRPSSFCMIEDTDQYVEKFLIENVPLTAEDLK